jgi:uncharacterized protein DUF1707/2TM domain-containing protein
MADGLDIRASDAERERTATLLRDHASEGRLDVDELDARLQQAYAARTRGDLEALTTDLPPAAPARGADPPAAPHGWGLRERIGSYLAVMVLLVVIWAVTGAGYFWPMWPAIGWGIALVTGKDDLGPIRHRRI